LGKICKLLDLAKLGKINQGMQLFSGNHDVMAVDKCLSRICHNKDLWGFKVVNNEHYGFIDPTCCY
jgi:hypothetical protein